MALMNKKKGLFIAIYGPDGMGKGRQLELLEERLKEKKILTKSFRYPVYDLVPSGKELDDILHKRKSRLPEEEMQKLFAKNRKEFEPTLKSWLDSGITVVAENYKGTGMVWGTVRGLSVEQMEEINKDTLNPDIAIYLDGPKREDMMPGHPYGVDTAEGEEEWYRVRKAYLAMADRYGWVRVGGDAPMLTVANRIWAIVKPVIEIW